MADFPSIYFIFPAHVSRVLIGVNARAFDGRSGRSGNRRKWVSCKMTARRAAPR